MKLLGLRYKICYRQGSTNNAADALSRRQHVTESSAAISICQPAWLEEVISSYTTNQQVQKIFSDLAV